MTQSPTASKDIPSPAKNPAISPMLKQYQQIKAHHDDCILFFRLGDFYEMFYEDAHTVSRLLNLVLTSRGKGTANQVPMCGFPHHAAENYIAKLIKEGLKVAICEQVEDPATTKGLVKRNVTRIITSGTYLDEHSVEARYVLCLYPTSKALGLSLIDPTTGTLQTTQWPWKPCAATIPPAITARLIELLNKFAVRECVFPNHSASALKTLFEAPTLNHHTITLTPCDDWHFNTEITQQALCTHFNVHNLNGFGLNEQPVAATATGALLEYLKRMNQQPLRHIDSIRLYTDDAYVYISPAAHRGLELDHFIKILNRTITPMGKRLFRFWCTHPLRQCAAIQQRQQAVTLLKDNDTIQQKLKEPLSQLPDLEKNISRLSCGYTHAKDLLALRQALNVLPTLCNLLALVADSNPLLTIIDQADLRATLNKAINPNIPLSRPEGKVIRPGYHPELDALRDIQQNGHTWLKNFQAEEIKRTGINSLKVGFNKVFGYYIEVTKANQSLVPDDFIRKQTLVNAERFITPELKEYEEKILSAEGKILKIEQELIRAMCTTILDHSVELHQFGQQVALIDALFTLSRLAQTPGHVLPAVDDTSCIDIRDGRHPVVERLTDDAFIPNDTHLDSANDHLIILTGPNMAGKSTYIRQSAILVIMAQMGSYVPASRATIGLVDKIFTRIGAHDDISKGQSTFMVEMNETADILNNVTEQSLVILDEIGRGTSTYDGLSLAWALAEHLQHTKARTLFATHFHELTVLSEELPGVKNYNVAVKEWKDAIIFLHKIIPGGSDDSYGIYVAKLAGIPSTVIQRARHILNELELKGDLKQRLTPSGKMDTQLDLFTGNSSMPSTPTGKEQAIGSKIIKELQALNINQLTPLEALNTINTLRKTIDNHA